MAAEGGPDMPAVDPTGRTLVRLGGMDFGVHTDFDTTFFVGWGIMQLSQLLLLIRCVWAVEREGSRV